MTLGRALCHGIAGIRALSMSLLMQYFEDPDALKSSKPNASALMSGLAFTLLSCLLPSNPVACDRIPQAAHIALTAHLLGLVRRKGSPISWRLMQSLKPWWLI